jgi:hypothetical protein
MRKSTDVCDKYILHKWDFMTLCKFLGYVHIIRTADMIALLQERS